MKNQILFILLLLVSFSCSKSDTDQPINEKILGDWLINSFVINSCPNPSDNFSLITADEDGCIDMGNGMTCQSIIFKEGGQAEVRSEWANGSPDTQPMTYQINETTNTISLCSEYEDCVTLSLEANGLFNDMDEQGCICTFGFKKS